MSIPSSLSPFDNYSGNVQVSSTSSAQITENTSCKRNPKALDVIYITTSQSSFKAISANLKDRAKNVGVPMEVLEVEAFEGDSDQEKIAALKACLHNLHRIGRIDQNTHPQARVFLGSSIKMSIARRCGHWQDRGAADSADVRQGDTNAASGILMELLTLPPNLCPLSVSVDRYPFIPVRKH